MPAIRVLPPEVVSRIAAGEVVERPASVLKELVENSIDASATEVLVDLEEGGKGLIRVRDNGAGIAPEDLPLAFDSHATSKLSDEDIERSFFGLGTLGFRGEALASVASVAMVEVVSRTHRAEHASRYRPRTGGGAAPPEPAAGGPGTTVEVRSLFYNTPARRKFLRSSSAELSHCVAQTSRLALGFPGVRFRLTHGGKPLLDLPACSSLRERLRQLAGNEVLEALLEVRRPGPSPEGPALSGFVGSPRLHRPDARGQSFFVNGRWVRDRMLSHALRSAYQGFQIPGRQPVAYLFLDLPPGDVDVNVHPTKTEVRFRESSEVYRLVHHAVRGVLEASGEGREPAGPRLGAGVAAGATGAPSPALDERRARIEEAVLELLAGPPERERPPFAAASPRADRDTATAFGPGPGLATAPAAFQVLRSYIVLDGEDGVTLIDQHAFHEKILFEEIHRRLREGAIERQGLLVPEVVDLPPALMPLLDRASEVLKPFGFEVEPFGPLQAAVRGFPALLDRGPGRADLPAILRSVLEALIDEDGGGEARDPLAGPVYRIASTVACKRAVKAGTALTAEEIAYLLERGDLARDPRHCPHGRPTTVHLGRRDIERRFDRK
ncbi:MAG: DNA mismatch repair endonuclease MutL [Planctomycetes bacterium]|nr:DNA mismatch repair endonuclease MutL [Planctomycetota bacterium]